MNFGAPPGLCDALRGFDKKVVVRTDGNDEFTNRARTNHVIAEKFEAILEPFRQRRQIRYGVLMKEVDLRSLDWRAIDRNAAGVGVTLTPSANRLCVVRLSRTLSDCSK